MTLHERLELCKKNDGEADRILSREVKTKVLKNNKVQLDESIDAIYALKAAVDDRRWLIGELERLWHTNDRLDAKITDLRIAVTNAEDEHKKHHPGVIPPYWLQRFREIAGPR